MIFNFYIPDEVITGMYGDCMRSPEEKEEIEKVFYAVFLSSLSITFPGNPDVMKFKASKEINDKMLEAAELIPKIIHRSIWRKYE